MLEHKSTINISIIEDDVVFAKILKMTIENPDLLAEHWDALASSFEEDEWDKKVKKQKAIDIFRQKSYSLQISHTPTEGLYQLRNEPLPDVILLDYDLPEMTGLDIFKKIKEEILPDKNEEPIIIVQSAQEDGDLVLEMGQAGVEYYIMKDEDEIPNLLSIISTGLFFEN